MTPNGVKWIHIMLEWVKSKFSEILQFLTSLNTCKIFGGIQNFGKSKFWSRLTPNGLKWIDIVLEWVKNIIPEITQILTSLNTCKIFEKNQKF